MSDINFADVGVSFALLVIANATPVLLFKLAGSAGTYPLDCGCTLCDGRRLFGDHKTWRGLIAGTVATAVVGPLLGIAWFVAGAFGLSSLMAHALSSAVKRRLRLRPGTDVFGLDQLGEGAVPLVLFANSLHLSPGEIAVVVCAFIAADVVTAKVRQRVTRSS
ncbi:MAG: CDP-archaeol synthase [Steroidobacteraceae bacterium]